MKIGIIGGGAAGFMAAITAKNYNPDAKVILLEKTSKLLSKVKVSGGGRCNVTNGIESPSQFAKNYPRGQNFMKKAFSQFSQKDTIQWFSEKGVKLKTESDGRIFPVSDDSQTIIDCLLRQCQKLNIEIRKNTPIDRIEIVNGFTCYSKEDSLTFDKIVITTGGSTKIQGFDWLVKHGLKVVPPIPSLFTFNMPQNPISELQGLSVQNATVKVQSTKLKSEGPLLITHWGMSGPAILKLSAWGARDLAAMNYSFNISINWCSKAEEEIREVLAIHSNKKIANHNPFDLPQRLWTFLIQKSNISIDKTWNEIGKKDKNKLSENLINDIYKVNGKTTFKEEFVTCGGIDLSNVSAGNMQAKEIPGMYFAGEVMDIDGITGGFNFQAAWTTGFIAGKSAAEA